MIDNLSLGLTHLLMLLAALILLRRPELDVEPRAGSTPDPRDGDGDSATTADRAGDGAAPRPARWGRSRRR